MSAAAGHLQQHCGSRHNILTRPCATGPPSPTPELGSGWLAGLRALIEVNCGTGYQELNGALAIKNMVIRQKFICNLSTVPRCAVIGISTDNWALMNVVPWTPSTATHGWPSGRGDPSSPPRGMAGSGGLGSLSPGPRQCGLNLGPGPLCLGPWVT